MRKIVVSNWMSIDGFFADPNGGIDWIARDPEVDKAIHEIMPPDPTLPPGPHETVSLFGRVTYQMFEAFWPHVVHDPNAPPEVLQLAKEVNQMTKVVFSTTLNEVTWEHSVLMQGNLIEEARRLKNQVGSNIIVFGSGTLVQQLANEGLIDDYLLAITPVVLGEGKPLFDCVRQMKLKLVQSRTFASGNILIHYSLPT